MISAVGSKKNILELPFYNCISDIFESKEIQKLGEYNSPYIYYKTSA